MPNGKVHSATTVVLSGALAYAGYRAGWPIPQAAALAGGALAGLLLSPDLDVDNGSISMAHARRMGGCFLGLVWAVVWKPYAMIIPHRSPLSHFPVIGTAIRLGYLALIGWVVMTLLHLTGVRLPALPGWWVWVVAGLALADVLHFILDITLKN